MVPPAPLSQVARSLYASGRYSMLRSCTPNREDRILWSVVARAGAQIRSLLRRLHGLQRSCRFASESAPPLDHGMM